MLTIVAIVLFLLLPALMAGGVASGVALMALWVLALFFHFADGYSLLRPSVWRNARGGAGLEVLTGFVTAPGAVNTALTMSTGDSLAVRATPAPLTQVRLLAAWTQNQVAGTLRIRSPKMHDNTQGLRLKSIVGEMQPLWRLGYAQRLFQTDLLTVDLTGSAVGGQIETAALLLLYDDLTGASGNFIDPPTLLKRMVNLVAIEKTIAVGAGGGWSGAAALNVSFDPWKANTDYALIGYEVDVKCCAVGWKGVDTGNLRVGGPGNSTFKELTGNWFIRLSEEYNMPLIPVFQSNNRGGVTIDAAQDQAAGAVVVNSIFAELAPK